MLSRMIVTCLVLVLALLGSSRSLSCRWMDHKFSQYSESSLDLLNNMSNNSTNSTEAAETLDTLPFPDKLYEQASKAPAEDKLAFMVQVLREVCALFEEDYSAASWEESTVEDFLNVVNKQAEELSSCIGSHGQTKKSAKLQAYFKRLAQRVLKENELRADSWELMRTEVKFHLSRVHLLASSLINN